MVIRKYFLAFFAICFLVACDSESEEENKSKQAEKQAIQNYIKEKPFVKIDENFYYRNDSLGSAFKLSDGDSVTFKYTGKLLSGTVITNNKERLPSSIKIGNHYLILGVEKGLTGMTDGEIGELVFASDYGYGAEPNGAINAYSPLSYTLEILKASNSSVKKEEKELAALVKSKYTDFTQLDNKPIYWKSIKKGETKLRPLSGDSVKYVYNERLLGGKVLFRDTIETILHNKVHIPGIRFALYKINKGDSLSIIMGSRYGHGKKGKELIEKVFVNGYVPIQVDLKLNDVIKMKKK